MKKGDIVRLKNLHPSWGKIGIVTSVNVTEAGLGQINMIARGCMKCSIPWLKRETYISEVINEVGS